MTQYRRKQSTKKKYEYINSNHKTEYDAFLQNLQTVRKIAQHGPFPPCYRIWEKLLWEKFITLAG